MVQACYKSLREKLHPLIGQLANTLEATWQEQLALSPYNTPADLGYIEGILEGERLTIENHCYATKQFRKLHLELAKVGNHLDILHCVMFPRSTFNLPIFGMDIVAGRGIISAAIVDLSPVSRTRTLPTEYQDRLSQLPTMTFSHPRDLPTWGNIFSDFCLFVRPSNAQEGSDFLAQATRYLSLHCDLALKADVVESMADQAAIVAGQHQYCLQQQQNDKTRRILERAFDADWADRYLRTMLFDCAETILMA